MMFYANDGSWTKKWTSSFCNYYGHMKWTHFMEGNAIGFVLFAKFEKIHLLGVHPYCWSHK
jgi:hypothetical protein